MKRMRKWIMNSIASTSGYSLVETTIAIAIVTGILVPLIALIASMWSDPIGKNVNSALDQVKLFAELCMAQQFADVNGADSSGRLLALSSEASSGLSVGTVRTESGIDSTNGLYQFRSDSWSPATLDTLASLSVYVWRPCE